jgi:hypothetical protein
MKASGMFRVVFFILCTSLFLFLAFSPAPHAGDGRTVEEGEFVIKYGVAETGSSRYSVREITENAENPSLEITTTTILYATIRKNQKMEFQQKLTALLDEKTLDIKKYTIENESPFKTEKTLMNFSPGGAEVKRTAGGVTIKNTLPYSELPLIVDIASPAGGNLNLPLLAYVLKKKKLLASDSCSFEALATGSFQIFSLCLEKRKTGTDAGSVVYELRGGKEGTPIVYTLHIKADDGRILKMESPDEHYSYAVGQGRKIFSPPDISAAFLVPLKNDLRNCGSVKAKIKLRLLQENITEETLKRCTQHFSGSMKDGILEGTISVSSINFKALDSLPFPPASLDESLKPCISPELLIESEDSDIKKQALALTRDARTIRDVAQRCGQWVYENIEFAYTDGSAKATLLTKKGDWIPRNRLFISLMRSLGIPARFTGGFLLTEKVAGNYLWTEVYFGRGTGWVPVDVALGQIDYFSANYITLWNHGFFDPYSVRPEIDVLEYKEEQRPKGTKFIVR